MKWILIWISLNNHPIHTSIELGRYTTMTECFHEREMLIERVGKPIINYQAICVPYDKDRLFKYGKPQPK